MAAYPSILLFAILALGQVTTAWAQRPTEVIISGVITDAITRQFVKDATVSLKITSQETKIVKTGSNGEYRCTIQVRQEAIITITVNHPLYPLIERKEEVRIPGPNRYAFDFEITKTSDSKITIGGYVRDKFTHYPISGADISYINSSGQKIYSTKTNAEGYYEFKSSFDRGAKVKIRVSPPPAYVPDEKDCVIIDPSIDNTEQDFYLTRYEDLYIQVTLRVIDPKKRKRIPETKILYKYFGELRDTLTDLDGEVLIKFPRWEYGGKEHVFTFEKPGYQTFVFRPTLPGDGTPVMYKVELTRARRFPWSAMLFTAGGASAITGGIMHLRAGQSYDRYLDFSNAEREADFETANRLRGGAIIAYGASVVTLAGGVALDFHRKKLEDEAAFGRLTPVISTTSLGHVQAGVTFRFSSPR